jgi:transcription initiation factor TFIIIB Brf1 subunit/transcription initiation factor TFIIB
MVWKKIVEIVAVSACPKCGNRGFDLEPGSDMEDPRANVKCGKCGYVCQADEFMRPVLPDERKKCQ